MNSEKVRIDEKGNCIVIFDEDNNYWAKPEDPAEQRRLEEDIEEEFDYEIDPDLSGMDCDFNELFLVASCRFMNDVLLVEEYVSLNEVLSRLGFKKQPFRIGYRYGWDKSDYVFFEIQKHDDYFEVVLNCRQIL